MTFGILAARKNCPRLLKRHQLNIVAFLQCMFKHVCSSNNSIQNLYILSIACLNDFTNSYRVFKVDSVNPISQLWILGS